MAATRAGVGQPVAAEIDEEAPPPRLRAAALPRAGRSRQRGLVRRLPAPGLPIGDRGLAARPPAAGAAANRR